VDISLAPSIFFGFITLYFEPKLVFFFFIGK